jgi:putative PIN family toxin of toxin-antitoxin system
MNEDDPRPRVVFDCMVYLQATVSESGPAATLLRLIDNDALSLFVSNDILEEVREVLSRPKMRERNPNLTDERVDALINRVLEKPLSLMTFSNISFIHAIRRMKSTLILWLKQRSVTSSAAITIYLI